MRTAGRATYWDTSAILSALFADVHSKKAVAHARSAGFHFVTSLGWTEAHAVMSRIERDGFLSRTLVDAARATLEGGPWRRINVGPNWNAAAELARKWPLRGADYGILRPQKSCKRILRNWRFCRSIRGSTQQQRAKGWFTIRFGSEVAIAA